MALFILESRQKSDVCKSKDVNFMAKLKKFDLQGVEISEIDLDEQLFKTSVNTQLVKDYLIVMRNNSRQWSAHTKGRREVMHSNAKPHPQKGTGRARQGCIVAPQYRGGGVVFGPKPKFNQHVRMNKKERRAATRYLLMKKICDGNLCFLQFENLTIPQTKSVCKFLIGAGMKDRKVLFLGDTIVEKREERELFYLSMRNIPKTYFLPITAFNGYDIAASQEVVVFDRARDALMNLLR